MSTHAATTEKTLTVRQESMGRAIANTVKGSLGNLVEWFDVYTYTVFAPYFEKHFFNSDDKNATFYTMAIFAVTFIMRPFGSWFFGRWADRHGRKSAMIFSVSLMAAASAVVAVLPTRTSVGIWAAVFLLLCRLVQGFATGGEYGTSATYMSEAAVAHRRGFFSSFQYVTLVGGHVLAQGVLLIMTATTSVAFISEWGWRIAFGIGGLAAIVVFWLRSTMDESLSSEHLLDIREGRDKASGTMRELLVNNWRGLLMAFLITLGGTVAFYTYSVNAPGLVKSGFGKANAMTATWINFAALFFLMVMQPIGGLISDKIGRKPLLVWFGAAGTVYTYFLLTYLPQMAKSHNVVGSLMLLLIGYVILSGYTSINALVKAELFPAHIRALGVGLGYGLANSIFGGTSPMVMEWAKNHNQMTYFISYVTVMIFISLLVYVFGLKNKVATHLDHEQGHAFEKNKPVADTEIS